MPWSAGTHNRIAVICSGGGSAELSIGNAAWSSTRQREGWSVKEIEKFGAEFSTISLSHTPLLSYGHVHVVELRAPEGIAAGISKRSVGWRSQNSAVLHVAGVI